MFKDFYANFFKWSQQSVKIDKKIPPFQIWNAKLLYRPVLTFSLPLVKEQCTPMVGTHCRKSRN